MNSNSCENLSFWHLGMYYGHIQNLGNKPNFESTGSIKCFYAVALHRCWHLINTCCSNCLFIVFGLELLFVVCVTDKTEKNGDTDVSEPTESKGTYVYCAWWGVAVSCGTLLFRLGLKCIEWKWRVAICLHIYWTAVFALSGITSLNATQIDPRCNSKCHMYRTYVRCKKPKGCSTKTLNITADGNGLKMQSFIRPF